MLNTELYKSNKPNMVELVIFHDGYEVLSILTEKQLVTVLNKVISSSYDLGKVDMRNEDMKPRLN